MAVIKVWNDETKKWEQVDIPALVGKQGPQGEKMKFSDLTAAEKEELRGKAFKYSDFTATQLNDLKVKGDAFTYEDFTPEQLEALRGLPGKNATINGMPALIIEGSDGVSIVMDEANRILRIYGNGNNDAGITASRLNRDSAVNQDDDNYTKIMARGSSLNAEETVPTVNGAIAWTYK